MRVRMKGKHIVLTLVAALLIAVLGVGYTTADSAEELYSAACSYLPALRQAQKPNAVYLLANSKMWSGSDATVATAEAERLLHQVVNDYPDSVWAKHAQLRLAELYLLQHDYSAAEEHARLALKQAGRSDYQARLLMLDVLERQGKIQEALNLIDEALSAAPYASAELCFRKAQLLAGVGEYQQARQLVLKLPETVRQEYSRLIETQGRATYEQNVAVWDQRIQDCLRQLELMSEGIHKAKVSGVITYLGNGVPGIEVRLVPASEAGSYPPPSWNQAPSCTTDEKGHFVFADVAPGSYTLALVLDKTRVKSEALVGYKYAPTITVAGEDVELELQLAPQVELVSPPPGTVVSGNQVQFVWQPVPGADYYTLRIGWQSNDCSTIMDYVTGISDTQYTVDINNAFLKQIVIRDGDGVMQPETLLGPFKLHDTIYWEVEAYDSAGRLLASSRQSDSSRAVQLGSTGLTAAEQYLASKDYPAAIKAYEQQLAANRQDTDALLMLARLYHYGWVEAERDHAKALSYYRQYLQRKNDPKVQALLDKLLEEMER